MRKSQTPHMWNPAFSFVHLYFFKNASAFLLRDARHTKHDIFLLRISAILPEAIILSLSGRMGCSDIRRSSASWNTTADRLISMS